MAADVAWTIWECPQCAKNRGRSLKQTQELELFPAKELLDSLAFEYLRPFSKILNGFLFILLIKRRLKKDN